MQKIYKDPIIDTLKESERLLKDHENFMKYVEEEEKKVERACKIFTCAGAVLAFLAVINFINPR